jgi:chromate reductase
MRLLALCGSLRAASRNAAALEACAGLAPAGVSVAIYRGLARLPAFNPDDDTPERQPAGEIASLRKAVGAADGLVIAAPEYAHGLPGAFKNALDWLVSDEAFVGKPVMLVDVAPRAFHAQASLREVLTTMSARLVAEAFVSLAPSVEQGDAQAIVDEPASAARLREGLDRFVAAIRAAGW